MLTRKKIVNGKHVLTSFSSDRKFAG